MSQVPLKHIVKSLSEFCCWIFPTKLFKSIKDSRPTSVDSLFSEDKNNLYYAFWLLVQIISLTQTFLELFFVILHTKTKNLIVLLYIGLQFITKLTVIFWFQLCSSQAPALNIVLRCIVNRNNVITKSPVSKVLYTILLFTVANVITVTMVMFPIVTFTLPCMHDSPIVTFVYGHCSTILFRVIISATTFLFMIPCAKYGALMSALFWLSLVKLNKFMAAFNSFLQSFKELGTLDQKCKVALLYRNMQVFVILNNSCFQTWVTSSFQFVGGS